MKLYKYLNLSKSENINHFYQMLFNCTMWCSNVDAFNDPQEFRFDFEYKESSATKSLLINAMKIHGKNLQLRPEESVEITLANNRLCEITKPIIDEMIKKGRNEIGVSCFSMSRDENHLWNRYGGQGNGVCVEFEIPDRFFNGRYHPVRYLPRKIFHIDDFLEAGCGTNREVMFRNMLTTKSKRWHPENEIRFISLGEVNVVKPVDGAITEIIFGNGIASCLRRDIKRIMQNDSRTRTTNIVISSSICRH